MSCHCVIVGFDKCMDDYRCKAEQRKLDDENKFVICSYCGCEELWPDEMSKSDPTMCDECEREECSHSNILREYQGSNDHRVRFLELCVKCKQTREVRLYFHNKFPSRTEWEYTGEY